MAWPFQKGAVLFKSQKEGPTHMASMNFISAALTQVLNFIDGIIGNYGVSVIVFTLLVRLVLLPLDIKSKKSMKAMERVKPQMDYLQKKYKDDQEKLNRKMQELYQKEKVNPMAGCLPMLLQLPIMFCMFTAMRVVANEQTVEMLMGMMNGIEPVFEPFLWVKNVFQPESPWATIIPKFGQEMYAISAVSGSSVLTVENVEAVKAFISSEAYLDWTVKYGADKLIYSAPIMLWKIEIPAQFNGLFILPILSAVTQFISSKMMPQQNTANQTEQQKTQSQMMQYFFPLFSLWICSTSTTAFTIYWVFSNVIQIVQTWAVNLYFKNQEKKQIKEA